MKKNKPTDDTMLKIGYAIVMGVFGIVFTTIAAVLFEQVIENKVVLTPLQIIFGVSFAVIMVFSMIKVFGNNNNETNE